MHFQSTRGGFDTDLTGAIMAGLAPDGGLLVPSAMPRFDPAAIDANPEAAELGPLVLAPFFAGSGLELELKQICSDAFNFPLPVTPVAAEASLQVLELFHGPTAAFKDVGARFLAATMERILAGQEPDSRGPLTILVATSGDTGGAVAAAFHRRPGTRVAVLFPEGQVSPRQQHQLTCWGDNVLSLAVNGSFDDCQALVKAAFTDPETSQRFWLSSANSINVGRLLPQSVYYASASLGHWRQTGRRANFIVPTGNLGNALACIWARVFGFPIGEVVLATNANRAIPDFLATGDWQPRASVTTLASAMDVGNPSNMERLRDLVPDFNDLRDEVQAFPVDDQQILKQVEKDYARYQRIWCPHTATAAFVYDQLPPQRRALDWILVATAHPAKFETVVEPVIGQTVPLPESLERILSLRSEYAVIDPELDALVSELE